jgi:uroporphyrinogen decarboxylase
MNPGECGGMNTSQLDCFRATVAHQPHEGILFYASFTPDLLKRVREACGLDEKADVREYFGMYAARGVALRAPSDYRGPDFTDYFSGYDIPPGAFINGLGVLEIPGSLYHFTQYVSPLRHASRFEEIEAFPYPHVTGFTPDHMAGLVQEAHGRGRVAEAWVGHMYENSWQVRGYTQFLMDMIERPEWCEHILDRFTERNVAVATAAARAGVDLLRTGDDVANQRAMMFSAKDWRRFMKPRWARVYAAARAIRPDIEIWYHSDGNVAEIIPELIEIGVTILNPMQPECLDLLEAKRKYGDKVVFDGTIGTQSTMPWGSPAEVKGVVRERVRTLGADGALILSPTHVLEPEVPIANIRAFVEAVREFGQLV